MFYTYPQNNALGKNFHSQEYGIGDYIIVECKSFYDIDAKMQAIVNRYEHSNHKFITINKHFRIYGVVPMFDKDTTIEEARVDKPSVAYIHRLDGTIETHLFMLKNEAIRDYWNRCKDLGNVSKGSTEIKFDAGRFVIREQAHPIAFIYEEGYSGTHEIIEAILCMFENQRKDIRNDKLIDDLIDNAGPIVD